MDLVTRLVKLKLLFLSLGVVRSWRLCGGRLSVGSAKLAERKPSRLAASSASWALAPLAPRLRRLPRRLLRCLLRAFVPLALRPLRTFLLAYVLLARLAACCLLLLLLLLHPLACPPVPPLNLVLLTWP